MRIRLLLVAAFLFVPGAAAGTPRLFMLHDATDDGHTYAGSLNQFGWVLLDEEGKTHVHKNAKIRVIQNGVVLYETLGGNGYSTAHDYDALNPVLLRLLDTGNYTIHAEVNVSAGLSLVSEFNGTVVARSDLLQPEVTPVDRFPSRATVGAPTWFKFGLHDLNHKILEHTDAFLEIRRADSNWLVFRTKLHQHTTPMELGFTFLEPGAYIVRIVAFQAYPAPAELALKPVAKTWPITVEGASPPVQAPAGFQPKAPGGFLLLHTYDPAPPGPDYDGTPVIGPYGNVRLNLLVYDPAAKRLVPHVDFEARLLDAIGNVLYSSKTLHEYDGHHEVVTAPGLPGKYRLQVTAKADGWEASKELSFQVAPPVNAVPGVSTTGVPPRVSAPCAGPVALSLTAPELKQHLPARLAFASKVASNEPCMHSEIELQWNDADGVPLLINKLHTHSDGKFEVAVRPPLAGPQSLWLDAETLDGQPSTSFAPSRLPIEVAAGPNFLGPQPIPATPVATPGPGAALLFLAGLLLLRRRA